MVDFKPVQLTAKLIEAFGGAYLSPMYDDAQPVPEFHRECWELYCSDESNAAVAAPRGHAKSTALTHTFGLAAALFRFEPHILVVSATEDLSMAHLGDMSKELHDNEELCEDFGIKEFLVDAKSEIVVRCTDGYEFRIIARGAGQKLRGMKWNGRRPGLILCDDMEEDEQVENHDRRTKFRKWVMRAMMPLGRRGARIRWHGTIMHVDSMLARLMKDTSWASRLFKAHNGFDDFTDILWPYMWSEARLKQKQREYISQGDPAGYSQEYLNDPLDNVEAYLQRDWFIPMANDDHLAPKIICAAADFAISKKDKANRTSITIGGKDIENVVHFVDQRVARWDALEIIDEMFDVHSQHNEDVFFVEDGQIWLSLWPQLKKEMQKRGVFINFVPRKPLKDKASRGRSLQRRMRAGGTRWNTDAHWFPGMQEEMLKFTGHSDATLDDQFDSAALLSLGFDDLAEVDSDDFVDDDEFEMRAADPRNMIGRNETTGY